MKLSSKTSSKPNPRRGVISPNRTKARSVKPRWKVGLTLGAVLGLAAAALLMLNYGRSDRAPASAALRNSTDARSTRPDRQVSAALNAAINRGNELLAQDKPEQALEAFSEALKINPADEDVHYDLGLVLARLGKVDEAISHYQEAVRLYPQYVEAWNNLGNLLMRAGRTQEAIERFQNALKISPEYASAHNNLGTALQGAGRFDEAIVHFERAARIKPDYWQAHFNVGASCLRAGRLTEASNAFVEVLRLKPDFEPARGALAQVESQWGAANTK